VIVAASDGYEEDKQLRLQELTNRRVFTEINEIPKDRPNRPILNSVHDIFFNTIIDT
jgi:hypothetical protein